MSSDFCICGCSRSLRE